MNYEVIDFHSLEWADLEGNLIDGMIKFEHIAEYLPFTLSKFERPDLFNKCIEGEYGDIAEISEHRRNILENPPEVKINNPSPELLEAMAFLESSNIEASKGSERGFVVHEGTLLELALDRAIVKLDEIGCISNKYHKELLRKIKNEKYVSLSNKIDILKDSEGEMILSDIEIETLKVIKDIRNIAAHSFKFNLENLKLQQHLKDLFYKVDLGKLYIFEKIKFDLALLLTHAYGVPCFQIRNKLLTYSYGRNILDKIKFYIPNKHI